jgi:hypothetical protein
MAIETATTSSTTQIDPTVQPFLKYGMNEAQRLYQAGGPKYFTGQGYVGPSEATQQGLEALRARAAAGSPLTAAAQNQLYGTIQGDYLGGNPFFQGAFQPAAQAATNAFNQAIGNVTSQASQAGRYGSGAVGNLQNQAATTLANSLTGTAGQLAYQNYAAERARQQQATFGAPQLAEADYTDINKLLAAGQFGEGYQQKALDEAKAKFAYEQNLPQAQLRTYLQNIGLVPTGTTTTGQTPFYTNPTATNLGTGLLGVQLLNQASPYIQSGSNYISNWLSGGSGGYANIPTSGYDLSQYY